MKKSIFIALAGSSMFILTLMNTYYKDYFLVNVMEIKVSNLWDQRFSLTAGSQPRHGVRENTTKETVAENRLAINTSRLKCPSSNQTGSGQNVGASNGLSNMSHPSNMPKNDSHSKGYTHVDKRNYWLTVSSICRLGNQMFQYAFMYCVTKSKPYWEPYMKGEQYTILRNAFGSSLTIPIRNCCDSKPVTIKEIEDADKMLVKLESLPTHATVILRGYFQSHKFFGNNSRGLRKQFTFPRIIRENVTAFFRQVTPGPWVGSNVTRVGIHVRRTDMVDKPRQRMGMIPSPPEYYQHAMAYFLERYERVQFLLASDDLVWCRLNIKAEHLVYSDHDHVWDLAMLTMCDHVIISIGTYSWWAGWLSRGTTLYHGVTQRNGTYMAMMYANNKWIPPDDQFNRWRPIL